MAGRTGTEIMIEKLIKMLGIDPAIILGHVAILRKSAENASGDLALIRRDQLRIMEKLGIDIHEQQDSADRTIGLNGSHPVS
jgi:hypothetical protein